MRAQGRIQDFTKRGFARCTASGSRYVKLVRQLRSLRGCGGMLPQKNFGISGFLRAYLVRSDLMSELRAAIVRYNVMSNFKWRLPN